MTTAYTSLLGLALPVTGELSGTWGDTVNNSITSLLDSAIAGTTTLSADTTLTTTTGASNQARQAILLCSGHVANITITAPAQSKIYTVINTSATYTVKIRGAGPTTGITIPVSSTATVAWNGSDFVDASTYVNGNKVINGNLTVNGNTTLGDASGDSLTINAGTVTLNQGTANGVAYLNGSKVLTTGSALTYDGTNLTVNTGTVSATYGKLTVAGGISITPDSSSKFQIGRYSAGAPYSYIKMGSTSSGLKFTDPADSVDLMTLDSAGNLGLGVTPVSSYAGYKTFQIASQGVISSDLTSNGALEISTNSYRAPTTASFTYINSFAATLYSQYRGEHRWYNAASGTAGNAITFTQAMTLDASGNLGVGVTTQNERLRLGSATAGQARMTIEYNGSVISYLGSYSGVVGSGNATDMLIGAANTLAFASGGAGTERARIDSSGNLLVGSSSQPVSGATGRIAISQSIADYSLVAYNTNATPYGIYQRYSTDPSNTGSAFYTGNANGTLRFEVRSNGGIANYSANNANLSDRREKTNFAPAGSYLDKICAIPVQTFNYIDQNMEDDGGLTLGVVAQDVQAVAPELVMESNWGTEEEPKMRLSIYQTDLQYALMKCIQEQQALITQLTARITALEGA